MFESLETGIGLDIVLWLQQTFGGSLTNVLVEVLDFANSDLAYVVLFALVYWLFNKQLGIRLLFALVAISLFTYGVKDLLARPRPYEVSADVMMLIHEETWGIPSGHVSFSLMLWGVVALWVKNRVFSIVFVGYVLLQGWARMVAGAHYPQDVVGGLLVGGITLYLYHLFGERIAQRWQQFTLTSKLLFSAGLVALLAILSALLPARVPQDYVTILGVLAGGLLGAALEPIYVRFTQHEARLQQALQVVIGLALCIGVLVGLDVLFDQIAETGTLADVLRFIRYAALALLALVGVPLLSIRLGWMRRE